MTELVLMPPPYEVVAAAYRPFDDKIRRWRDLDIAEWLGLKQERNIRAVIEANSVELERHGELHAVRAVRIQGQTGPAATEFWLNYEQALLLCTLSRTPKAEDVRTVMIRVFSAVSRGELEPTDGAMVQLVGKVGALTDSINNLAVGMSATLQKHGEELVSINERLDNFEKSYRREPKESTRRAQLFVLSAKFSGECPCCRLVQLIDASGSKTVALHWDHFSGNRWDASFENIWPICECCHKRKHAVGIDQLFKVRLETQFRSFQQICADYRPKSSLEMPMPEKQSKLFN